MIRAALLNAWPALSMHFGIHPWDVGRLTLAEIDAYVSAAEDIAREAQRTEV